MPSIYSLSALGAILASVATAADPFNFCKDPQCGDCPASVTSAGTGYPACVVYNSDDVFAGQGYTSNEAGGGYSVYFDVEQPQQGCATIVRSPADTTELGCGTIIGSFTQASCAKVPIKSTFMVQFCCGNGDCGSAGVPMRFARGEEGRSVSIGARGVYLNDANGTVIEPIQVGYPPAQKPKRATLSKRSCNKNSWVQDGETYTKPADNVQIVANGVNGGAAGGSVMVSTARTQEWSTTIMAGLTVEDIFSLGVSQEFSQSITKTDTVTVNIPAGQSGSLGFTATLTCSKGSGTCNDGEVDGEVCWPGPSPGGDDVLGTYAVVISS